MKKKKELIWESERKYNALTKYDCPTSWEERTAITIDMKLFKPEGKISDYDLKKTYGFLARVTSIDGMCHMTFNIVTKGNEKYFQLEFYDIVSINYNIPKLQQIYENLDQYIDYKIDKLPSTVEGFVELLIKWFEGLEPLLSKYRDKRRKEIEKEQAEIAALLTQE